MLYIVVIIVGLLASWIVFKVFESMMDSVDITDRSKSLVVRVIGRLFGGALAGGLISLFLTPLILIGVALAGGQVDPIAWPICFFGVVIAISIGFVVADWEEIRRGGY